MSAKIHPYRLRAYHNPDNVHDSEIPKGWRLLYKDEFPLKPGHNFPCRLYIRNASFGSRQDCKGCSPTVTYIIPINPPMKTKTEIVVETIQYYLQDPANRRSVSSEGVCLYQHPENPDRQCAVGRCFQPDTLKDLLFDPASNCKTIHELAINDSIDHLLKPEYRGHDLEFWRDLQNIHDNPGFWSDSTTDRTKAVRRSLISRFDAQTYSTCVKLNFL